MALAVGVEPTTDCESTALPLSYASFTTTVDDTKLAVNT